MAVDSAVVIENNGYGVDSTGIGAETKKEPDLDSAPPTNYTSFVDIVTYDNEIKDSATVYLDGQFKGNLLELNGQLPVSADSQHTIEIRWDRQFSPIVSKFTVKPYSRFNIFIDDSLERK